LLVNDNFHFGTQADLGECLRNHPTQVRATDCEIRNSLLIHCYSLFFLADKNREFP